MLTRTLWLAIESETLKARWCNTTVAGAWNRSVYIAVSFIFRTENFLTWSRECQSRAASCLCATNCRPLYSAQVPSQRGTCALQSGRPLPSLRSQCSYEWVPLSTEQHEWTRFLPRWIQQWKAMRPPDGGERGKAAACTFRDETVPWAWQ
jgi:hypothetical protein